jgi:peptidoglycan/LPS O-acetylase OafA/YrhL
MLNFYARRMKRLVPALAFCVVITSALTCLFDPAPGSSLQTGLSALVGASNIYLFSQSTDYFAPSSELNTFTQTWSLGVEEQFYFLFPLLLGTSGFWRNNAPTNRRNQRRLGWIIFRAPRKIDRSAPRGEVQASCCNASRGTVSVSLGIFRGTLYIIRALTPGLPCFT